jgi:predicted DNA-binding transcriptional regulator YafY
VKLTRSGVMRCETDAWLHREIQHDPDGNGTLETMLPSSFVPWAVDFFLSCGEDAVVLEPDAVKEGIREKARKVSAMYS